MKPEELRIGNLIEWCGEEVKQSIVVSITEEHGKIWINGNQSDFYGGIPLTEEWLEKFGFEKKRDNIYSPKGCYEYEWHKHDQDNIFPYGTLSLQSKDTVVFASVRKVHELQNLHFALTGIELKKKL